VKYRLRILAAVLGAASVGAFAVACGGASAASGGSGGSGGTAVGTPGGNSVQAYLSCLSQNGVTITLPSGRPRGGFPSGRPRPSGARPSGGPGGGGFGGGLFQKPAGVDDATWQRAQTACASVRPSFGAGAGSNNGALSAYRNCLANHGVTMSAGPGALNTADPTVAAAERACAVLRPSQTPG
jgi:hypothetical protein